MSNSEDAKFCRACRKEMDNECNKTYIFEETSDTLEIFRTCTTLEINKLDQLPAYICEQCNVNIINFHQFQLTCKSSDLYFRGKLPFECKLCGTTFQKLRSLILHNDAKHNEAFQKIPCNYDRCDRAFTTKQGLKEHISNIHLGIKKPKVQSQISYVCELCGKSFKNKTSLKKHSYCHTGEKPFGCSYCPKRFTVKDKLKNHIMRHENIKNFECNYCGMRKVTMAELKIHMNSHTMDKVYPCPQCSAVFSRDGNAKRHFRIVHRGYKPYNCTTCQQSFSKKETLKHHEMTHSGEKPHFCSICDKRFIQPIALKKHLNVHSKQAMRMAEAQLSSNADPSNK